MDYTFTDGDGREWQIPKVTLRKVMAFQEATNIDLDAMISDGHFWNVTNAAMVCVGAMLWNLCQSQHECTEEQFFDSFEGETFDDAQEKLAQRVANFIPSARRAAMLNVMKIAKDSILSANASSSPAKETSLNPSDTASESSSGLQPAHGI